MSGNSESLLLCYNKGCGQQFDPKNNGPEACRHHTGVPVFHDAYKSWSCCKKRCIDFTEFLNIKGCTVSTHTNVKPPEAPKREKEKNPSKVIVYKAPEPWKQDKADRPSFDTPMTVMNATVSSALTQQLEELSKSQKQAGTENDDGTIPIGAACKNNCCKQTYGGPGSEETECKYHPGQAIFHEGLKYWSCCCKKTTDFNSFLDQVGCKVGKHVFLKEKNHEKFTCRVDWHQTGSDVYISIFGKKCDPSSSVIEISPVRLKFSLFFPEIDQTFSQDMELRGIIDVAKSSVSMFPSKIEIRLRKNGPGNWRDLEIIRMVNQPWGDEGSTTMESQEDRDSDDLVDLGII